MPMARGSCARRSRSRSGARGLRSLFSRRSRATRTSCGVRQARHARHAGCSAPCSSPTGRLDPEEQRTIAAPRRVRSACPDEGTRQPLFAEAPVPVEQLDVLRPTSRPASRRRSFRGRVARLGVGTPSTPREEHVDPPWSPTSSTSRRMEGSRSSRNEVVQRVDAWRAIGQAAVRCDSLRPRRPNAPVHGRHPWPAKTAQFLVPRRLPRGRRLAQIGHGSKGHARAALHAALETKIARWCSAWLGAASLYEDPSVARQSVAPAHATSGVAQDPR